MDALNKRLLFAHKMANINVSRSAAPKLALVPATGNDCDVKRKRFRWVPMASNLTRVFFAQKLANIKCFEVCCPGTSSCASKPLLLRCKVVIYQCMCQVLLELKEVQMGTHVLKLNKVPFFARKPSEPLSILMKLGTCIVV